MLFNSFQFLFLFLPLTLAGALWLENRSRTALVWWLIGASIVFYGAWNARFLWVLGLSILVNWSVALAIVRASGRWRQSLLVLGLVWNLALLGYFKYTNFLGATLRDLSGYDPGWAEVVLPIGISFFTFQKIAFLVDAYRGEASLRSFGRFALFVLFFPQLIAGPIVHHAEFVPQLDRKRRKRLEDLCLGLVVLSIGLVKKLYIADTAAIPASAIFDAAAAGSEPDFATAWFGALAYAAQIYFDFSAYSDMAVGLARMFGFDLPINFASPYKARSIVEFWRRWHITLSRFLRDYLYIPLGGNRAGKRRRRINLMVTMALGGFWHGAGWTFLLWGILHGIYLLVAHGFSHSSLGKRASRLPGWGQAMHALTFVAVVIAWVPFRAADLATTSRIWQGMFALADGGLQAFVLDEGGYVVPVALALAIAFFAPNTYELFAAMRLGLATPGYPATEPSQARLPWRWTPAYAMLTGLAIAAVVLKLNDISAFIYFQF
jgi:D-alanyl-lipoteichoic acid acyltransferase DltB (MBOAT superfamily)